MGVADLKLDRQSATLGASPSRGDHVLTAIDGDDPAAGSDALRQRPRIFAGAAADLKNVLARLKIEQREGVLLVSLKGFVRAGLIEKADEIIGIVGAIDVGETEQFVRVHASSIAVRRGFDQYSACLYPAANAAGSPASACLYPAANAAGSPASACLYPAANAAGSPASACLYPAANAAGSPASACLYPAANAAGSPASACLYPAANAAGSPALANRLR